MRLAALAPHGATLRCRITHGGVAVEIGEAGAASREAFADIVAGLCSDAGRVFAGVRAYRRGAMFVRG